MSKAIRRSKKLNSDNDNLYVYDEGSVAIFGPVPYEPWYDYGKNGASHLTESLFLEDNNTFIYGPSELDNIKFVYKI